VETSFLKIISKIEQDQIFDALLEMLYISANLTSLNSAKPLTDSEKTARECMISKLKTLRINSEPSIPVPSTLIFPEAVFGFKEIKVAEVDNLDQNCSCIKTEKPPIRMIEIFTEKTPVDNTQTKRNQ